MIKIFIKTICLVTILILLAVGGFFTKGHSFWVNLEKPTLITLINCYKKELKEYYHILASEALKNGGHLGLHEFNLNKLKSQIEEEKQRVIYTKVLCLGALGSLLFLMVSTLYLYLPLDQDEKLSTAESLEKFLNKYFSLKNGFLVLIYTSSGAVMGMLVVSLEESIIQIASRIIQPNHQSYNNIGLKVENWRTVFTALTAGAFTEIWFNKVGSYVKSKELKKPLPVIPSPNLEPPTTGSDSGQSTA